MIAVVVIGIEKSVIERTSGKGITIRAVRADKVAYGIEHARFHRDLFIRDDVGFVINLPNPLWNTIGRRSHDGIIFR